MAIVAAYHELLGVNQAQRLHYPRPGVQETGEVYYKPGPAAGSCFLLVWLQEGVISTARQPRTRTMLLTSRA